MPLPPALSPADWVRVKVKDTGHKISVQQSVVDDDPDTYQVLKQDAVDHVGRPLDPEFADSAPASASSSASSTSKEGA